MDWLERSLHKSFFEQAGKLSKPEIDKRISEIPPEYHTLAYTLLVAAKSTDGTNVNQCCEFRQYLYLIYKKLLDNGIDIKLPHFWFADGVMILPEHIVRITNGIIGWKCDESRLHCKIHDECIYFTCPHDPTSLKGESIGMYHCPECGDMVLAGMNHPYNQHDQNT